jgi:tRNA acetyltransferase TAN1
MALMDFNLIISTGREFEKQAECEMWFNLLALGDESPIIFKPGISGLILAKTTVDPLQLIKYLQNILETKDPKYIQFLKKIYPIELCVNATLEEIKSGVLSLVEKHPLCQNPKSKFRITVRKRLTSLKTQEIVSAIAGSIDFDVSLQEFDWNVQIEIIGEKCGIAIITDDDIFKLGATS